MSSLSSRKHGKVSTRSLSFLGTHGLKIFGIVVILFTLITLSSSSPKEFKKPKNTSEHKCNSKLPKKLVGHALINKLNNEVKNMDTIIGNLTASADDKTTKKEAKKAICSEDLQNALRKEIGKLASKSSLEKEIKVFIDQVINDLREIIKNPKKRKAKLEDITNLRGQAKPKNQELIKAYEDVLKKKKGKKEKPNEKGKKRKKEKKRPGGTSETSEETLETSEPN